MRAVRYRAVLIALLCSLAVQQRAQAQYNPYWWGWRITYEPTGSSVDTSSTSGTQTWPWTWTDSGYGNGFTAPGYGPFVGGPQDPYHQTAGSATRHGTVVVRAVWTRPDYWYGEDVPPPNTVSFLVESSANWNNWRTGSSVVLGETIADNGQGDLIWQEQSPDVGATCIGRHIKTFDGSSGVVTFPINLDARVSVTIGQMNDSTHLSAMAYVHAQEDTRKIVLHRPGANGEWVDNNGVTHGDTRFSYHQQELIGFPPLIPIWREVINWQEFEPTYYGPWHWKLGEDHNGQPTDVPDVDWWWSPSFSGATVDWNKWAIMFGAIDYNVLGHSVGTHTPATTRTMSYTAVDHQDSAVYTANYLLTFHDEWDNWHITGPPIQNVHIWILEVPGRGPFFVDGPATPSWTFTITGTVTFSTAFNAGFEPDDAAKFGITTGGSAAVAVGSAVGITAEAIPAGMHVFPYVVSKWKTVQGAVDGYDTAGPLGTFQQNYDDPLSYTEDAGWSTPRPISDTLIYIGKDGL